MNASDADCSPALVILAAGASRRLGNCKALVDLDGQTPLARLIQAGAVFGAAPVLVIAGAHFDLIRDATPSGVEVRFNPRWHDGRTGGVLLAQRERPGRDLVLAPVDVPLVPASVFQALAAAWRDRGCPPHGWLAPAVRLGGKLRHGHPIVVGRTLLQRLSEVAPDAPLRDLRGFASPLWSAEVGSTAVLDDLDTPDDLKELRTRLTDGR